MTWLFTSGGQSIGALASASVLPMNIQGLVFTKPFHIVSILLQVFIFYLLFLPLLSTDDLTVLPLEKKMEASRWTLTQLLVTESVNFMPLSVSFLL